jgi:MoaA/NifB/PqqE/SkfB family radical SAM enzyme
LLTDLEPTPSYVQIEPVGVCNLRCQMCPISFREDRPVHGSRRYMDFDLYTRLVDEFENLQNLHLQGLGEPMLHPQFFEMVEYAAARGIHVTINTNMTQLTPAKAERCVTSGLEGLFFSIDGATAETYEAIRVHSSFAKVLANLELLIDTKRRLASRTPQLKLVMVLMRQNLAELPDLVRLAHRFGLDEVFGQQISHDFGDGGFSERYRPLHEYVDEQSLLYEDLERVQAVFSEARQVAAELGVRLRLPPARPKSLPADTPGRDRCNWPWTGAYISYQGYAMPCCMVASPDQVNLGLLDGSNLQAVWYGPEYQAFRRQLASPAPPDICRNCSLYLGHF